MTASLSASFLILVQWRSTQINPSPVQMIKEALLGWDGMGWDAMECDGMVIIGQRSFKSTFGANNKAISCIDFHKQP